MSFFTVEKARPKSRGKATPKPPAKAVSATTEAALGDFVDLFADSPALTNWLVYTANGKTTLGTIPQRVTEPISFVFTRAKLKFKEQAPCLFNAKHAASARKEDDDQAPTSAWKAARQ